MSNATTHYTIGNKLCGDTIEVFLHLNKNIITQYSYAGVPSPITRAAAEFLGDNIIGMSSQQIFDLDANRVKSQGFEVSYRRRRSSVSALLGVRNALHIYLKDGIIDEYEDILD